MVTVKLVDSRYGVSQQAVTVQVKSASTPVATHDSEESPDGRIPKTSTSPIPTARRSVVDAFGGRKPILILAGVIGVLLLGVLLPAPAAAATTSIPATRGMALTRTKSVTH